MVIPGFVEITATETSIDDKSSSHNYSQEIVTNDNDDCNDNVVQASTITLANDQNHTTVVLENNTNSVVQQKPERPKYLPTAPERPPPMRTHAVTSTVRNSDSFSDSMSSFDSDGSFDTEPTSSIKVVVRFTDKKLDP